MIKTLKIVNFESHKDSILNFSPGVNIIFGASDSGKTSILRSLRWAINNRPVGSQFVSHQVIGEKGEQKESTHVGIEVDDLIVHRMKSDDFNGYEIENEESIDAGAPLETFSAINKDVPEEITKIFNIGDVNIQRQHDTPFLLGESAPEVARYLNQIVHLDDIDKVLTSAESMRRDMNSQLKVCHNNLEYTKEELEKFAWIEDAGKIAEGIATRSEKIESVIKKIDGLSGIISKVGELEKKTNALSFVDKVGKTVDKITEKMKTLNQEEEESASITSIAKEIIAKQKEIETLDKVISAIPLSKKIQDEIDKCDSLEDSLEILQGIVNTYTGTRKKMSELDTIIEMETKNLPDTCPLCGSSIKEAL